MQPSKIKIATTPDTAPVASKQELDGKTRVGPLVAKNPAYASVFEKRMIDYCCKGNKSLQELCDEKNINVTDVLHDLNQVHLTTPAINFNDLSAEDLIAHVIEKHHNYLREELPRLKRLINKVASKHSEAHPELVELQNVYEEFHLDLLKHIEEEEAEVFPAILSLDKDSSTKELEKFLADMEAEHLEAGSALEKMNELTNGYTPPKYACTSYLVMLNSLASLEKDLHEHVHKENHILFPKVFGKKTS